MPIPVVKINQDPVAEAFGHIPSGTSLNKNFQANSNKEGLYDLDDLVFEHRNREYGAYVLRKGYVPNVYKGFMVATGLVLLLIFFPSIVGFFRGDDPVINIPTRKLVYSELTAPPPIDKPKPPPPQLQLPKLQKVIKFVPPKVVRENVAEEVPAISEIKQNETGAVSVEGTEAVFLDEPVTEVVAETDEIFTIVEQQPEFDGGYEALMNFIRQHMVYPPMARRMQIEGTVHVSFLVSKTGAISEVKVLRGISAECDKEAIRVAGMMPPWIPGKQAGRPVAVRFIMPLKFRLH